MYWKIFSTIILLSNLCFSHGAEQPVCCQTDTKLGTENYYVTTENDFLIRFPGSSACVDFRWNWNETAFDCSTDPPNAPYFNQLSQPSFLKSSNTVDLSNLSEFCVEAWFNIVLQCVSQTEESFNTNYTQLPFFFYGDPNGQYAKIDFADNSGVFSLIGSNNQYTGKPRVTFQGSTSFSANFPGWTSIDTTLQGGSPSNYYPDVTNLFRINPNLNFYTGGRQSHFAFCTNASTSYVVHTQVDFYNTLKDTFYIFPSSFGSIASITNSNGNYLYFGGDPTTQNSFLGLIDEIRIWNTMRSYTDIQNYRFATFDPSAFPSNLIHYWKLDGNLKDAVGGSDLIFTPGSQMLNYYLTSPSIQQPLYSFGSSNSYTTYALLFGFETPFRDYYTSVNLLGSVIVNVTLPLATTLSIPNGVSLYGNVAISGSNNYNFVTYSAMSRALCAISSETINLQSTSGTSTTYRYIHVNIVSNSPTLSGINYPNSLTGLPTQGGLVTIPGFNLGPPGALVSGESVIVYFGALATNSPCSNPTVTSNSIQCTVPPGVGAASQTYMSITICGVSQNISFGFLPPTINNNGITVTATSLLITGKNFGEFLTAVYVGVGNNIQGFSTAVPKRVNDTFLEVLIPSSFNAQTVKGYQLNLTVGGQSISQLADISPGQTINPLASKPTSQIPVIVGSSVAAVLVLIIIVLLILLIIYRRRKARNTAPFTPVEKKDFTPIIFGNQSTTTAEDKKKAGDIKALEDLLVQDDLKLALKISDLTQITEADAVAKALVIVFEAHDKTLHLLKKFIQEEVEQSESASTLFRSNSMVSKMFKFYSRLIGLPYLYVAIGQQLNQLIWEGTGLEVDPERMEEGADLDEMRWTLMMVSQKILKGILSTVDKCPVQFRVLCKELQTSVGKRFPPDTVNKTIGGFIFLRFFCPAVTSPESYGIVDEQPSADSRRLLILMTKVLQNLSNNVEFGSKELYMTKMNDFIQSNRDKLNNFFAKLINVSDSAVANMKPAVLPKGVKEDSLVLIGKHLQENLGKIEDPVRFCFF